MRLIILILLFIFIDTELVSAVTIFVLILMVCTCTRQKMQLVLDHIFIFILIFVLISIFKSWGCRFLSAYFSLSSFLSYCTRVLSKSSFYLVLLFFVSIFIIIFMFISLLRQEVEDAIFQTPALSLPPLPAYPWTGVIINKSDKMVMTVRWWWPWRC